MVLEHLSICEKKIIEYKRLLEKLDKNPESLFWLFQDGRKGLFYLMMLSAYKKDDLMDYFLTYFVNYLKQNYTDYQFEKNLELIIVKYDHINILSIDIFDKTIEVMQDDITEELVKKADEISDKSHEVYRQILKLEEKYSDIFCDVERTMETLKTAMFSKKIKKDIKKEMVKLNGEFLELNTSLNKIELQINKRRDEILYVEDKKEKMVKFLQNKFSFKIKTP